MPNESALTFFLHYYKGNILLAQYFVRNHRDYTTNMEFSCQMNQYFLRFYLLCILELTEVKLCKI